MEETRNWHAPALSHFPFLATLCLAGTLVGVASSFVVLYFANDSRIDRWPLAPTIYLSIIAALTNRMLGAAFRYAADIHWWSKLVSDEGVTIQELHSLWDLAYNPLSLLIRFSGNRIHPVVRLGAIFVSLMAINGPFLQRAVIVELETRTSIRAETLSIRQEPMWNLTTRYVGLDGHIWTAPPYQDEFAQIALELSQRLPMTLQSAACGMNSTCSTNVTIAGFNRSCSQSSASLKGIRSTNVAEYIHQKQYLHACPFTGFEADSNNISSQVMPGNSSSYCRFLETAYQLAVTEVQPFSKGEVDTTIASSLGLPWKSLELPPAILNYTNYFRRDVRSEEITIQSCNFSTAFIQLPIKISNGSVVTLTTTSSSDVRGIESIPDVISGMYPVNLFIAGISQMLMDQYGGYILYDREEGSHIIQGSSPRQYVNQSSIDEVQRGPDDNVANTGYLFSMVDPLEDFTRTINEISLRYALKTIPDDEKRRRELDKYVSLFTDKRPRALPLMEMPFSKTSEVQLQESETVAVYRSQYAFTAVAVGVTSISSFFIIILLHGWRRLGRKTSLAPLEIAKAFDAPLLSSVPSNSTGDDIAAGRLLDLRVKYGEVYPTSMANTERRSLLGTQGISILPAPHIEDEMFISKPSAAKDSTDDGGHIRRRAVGRRRLAIEAADLVTKPRSRTTYY